MDDDAKIVEVKTAKAGPPPTTSGITLLAVAMIIGLGLIVYAAKYAGDAPQTPPPADTTQVK